MKRIKFGTDGWRGITADDFTVANVIRLTDAVASWLRTSAGEASVVVGYDTRFGSRMFAETAARVFAARSIKVFFAPSFVTSPMVSLGLTKLGARLGVMVTGSHNGPEWNGIKLKGHFGGSLFDEALKNIEDLAAAGENILELELIRWEDLVRKGMIEMTNLQEIYSDHVKEHFDLESLIKSGVRPAFDAMNGSTQDLIRSLFTGLKKMNTRNDPMFGGINPEPVASNLEKLSETIRGDKSIDLGFAFDGDGDRIAVIGGDGKQIPTHLVILMLIRYLAESKGRTGKVVAGYSCSATIDALCRNMGIDIERTRSGFRHITRIMTSEQVLVGGEQSGGIAFAGHIPDRDGIWTALTLWQMLVETGKKISDLLEEAEKISGKTWYDRIDIRTGKDKLQSVSNRLSKDPYTAFGPFRVTAGESLDGHKYFIGDTDWVLIRISGTEPLIRVYAETGSEDKTSQVLNAVKETLAGK